MSLHQKTCYAKSGNVNIAYQVMGDGPVDLVLVPGWISNLEEAWQNPELSWWLERLASFSRVVLFDKRGTGLSDRVSEYDLPGLDERMDDLRAVMDAAGLEQANVLGISEGGPLSMMFAATYPEKVTSLIVYGSYAKWVRAEDYPWAPTHEHHMQVMQMFSDNWGTAIGLKAVAPSVADDRRHQKLWAKLLRSGASPGSAMALYRMNIAIDVRDVLSSVRVPTLILHRSQDRLVDSACGRFLADSIPDSRYVEVQGIDHLPWIGDVDTLVAHIQEFLTGERRRAAADRTLATLLFADIVDSTGYIARRGDAQWRRLQGKYFEIARELLESFRGSEFDTAGDGLFAGFDGPARAVHCARAINDAARNLDLYVRIGVHTGECERGDGKLTGLAVHIAARIAARAEAGQVLVSSTVRDLIAGSGVQLRDIGRVELKGVPDLWRLYEAAQPEFFTRPPAND